MTGIYDSIGREFHEGDVVLYVNPKFPHPYQQLHKLVRHHQKDCLVFQRTDGSYVGFARIGKDGKPHPFHGGTWKTDRWTIVDIPFPLPV